MTALESLFHKLWTRAVGTPDYDKGQWRQLEETIHAYPRLVLALRNLVDAPTDDNGAAVRIELRRAARLLLAELGEVKVCLHGTGRVTPGGWECSNCGEVFIHGPTMAEGYKMGWPYRDPLSPAHAWPDIPEFLKRKSP